MVRKIKSFPPQAFMIYKEELEKERLEKERLKKEYTKRTEDLTNQLDMLKERLSSQQQMMEAAYNYASDLEEQLNAFKKLVKIDEDRNSSGYH